MLNLTRRVNESIIIQVAGETVEVIIRQVNGKQVRVGVDARKHVNIARKEIANLQHK